MIARYAVFFFLFVTVVAVPLVIALLSRLLLPRRLRWWVAGMMTCVVWGLVWYGSHDGFEQLQVRHMEYASADLPAAFDGYRIVQFSDAHVGTYTGGRQWLLARAVDSINAQHPDAIVFTGDLQNVWPDELTPHIAMLSRLHARDGVFSVLGNHDYAVYQDCNEAEKLRHCRETIEAERRMGWALLLNEHRIVRRDTDSIVIAGMENWGKTKRMPRRGDVCQTLFGLVPRLSQGNNKEGGEPFIVMLQHDPTAWRLHILPECHAQLTLSGHTHGGQFSVFGWSPASLAYDEWKGEHRQGNRSLFVSTGLGALIPFRLGMPGEIVVITLRKK